MAIVQGGPEDAVTTRANRTGSDPGPERDAGLRGRGVRPRAPTDVADAPAQDQRGALAARLAPAERHARLVDRFIAQYATDTGAKASAASVKKVAVATGRMFAWGGKVDKALFQGAKQAGIDGTPLSKRKYDDVSVLWDFSSALGARAEGRLEHFHRVIQADPNLLKTKMGMLSRSTREQRLKMRSIAAGLLLCGFNRDSVAYAMKAMRAAINKGKGFDADLNTAYDAIGRFIKSGGADRDFADMLGAGGDLADVRDIVTNIGGQYLPKEPVPDLLRGVIEDSRPWPAEDGNAAPAGAISRDQIDQLKHAAANVASDQVNSDPDYVERQSGQLCGKHAANAYLHGNVITEQSLTGFLKLNSFWKDPDLESINDEGTFDPTKGNDPDNMRHYLNWLNAEEKLGDDQKPLVTNHGTDWFSGYNISNLKDNPPTDSHMMYYSFGRGFKKLWPEFAHFVTFHPGQDGDFRLYDSKTLGGRLPKKDPVKYAESCFTGPHNSDDNQVVIVRPAKDVFETRREFALAMTVDKIQQLNGTRMRLLDNFLQKITDPGSQFDNADKRQEFRDKLGQRFPLLWDLANRVDLMGANERPMSQERQEMRQLVDDAAREIARMDRPDQLRLAMLVINDFTAVHARQNYAEHVVQQRYPSLSQKQIEPIGTAIHEEMDADKKRQPPLWPEDHALEPDDCAALDRIALRVANQLFGPPEVAPPPQAPPALGAAGAAPADDYRVPNYDPNEEK